LNKLENLLTDPDSLHTPQDLADVVKTVEQHLSDALQRFPNESYILDAEAQFADITSDEPRILAALQKAFDMNPRSTYLATRLTSCYRAQDNLEDAKAILIRALDANRSDKRLHYAYARLLMDIGEMDGTELAYHLHRSYTVGDSNYDAQILYGRQLMINGDLEGSRRIFNELNKFRVSASLRNACLYPLKEVFTGEIARKEAGYCFVNRDGINDWIYAHISDFDNQAWESLCIGSRISFRIGFSLRGTRACDIQIEDKH